MPVLIARTGVRLEHGKHQARAQWVASCGHWLYAYRTSPERAGRHRTTELMPHTTTVALRDATLVLITLVTQDATLPAHLLRYLLPVHPP